MCKLCGGPTKSPYGFCQKTRDCRKAWCRARYEANKKAHLEVNKRWLENNKERRRITQRKWDEKNPVSLMLTRARSRAKKSGLEFSIIAEDVHIPELCPIFGLPLEKGSKNPQANSPSIDRIDNSKGYVPGNVQVISNRANAVKADYSPDELLKFAEWIYKTYANVPV